MADFDKRRKKIIIKLFGIVQGVGFRPFARKTAQSFGLCGRVLNDSGAVTIEAVGEPECLNRFYDAIIKNKPSTAEIIVANKTIVENDADYHDFLIDESVKIGCGNLFPSPDISICASCEHELFDHEDRRFKHPFISCTACGPRYTVIEDLPYDRARTAMKDFDLCPFCREQYYAPNNRREHAQTIACNDCGPRLIFKSTRLERQGSEALYFATNLLNKGEIVAIKGIGGYHLACRPFDINSVRALRELKGREQKPFAVMFATISQIEKYCTVSNKEQKLLTSREKPIVILSLKDKEAFSGVSGKNGSLGAFLPYTPLHHLILEKTGPLIMTSGNYSDAPIEIEDDKILALLDRLGGVLYNDREILRRADDSVMQVAGETVQMIRRGRGFVPAPIFCGRDGGEILSCGGQLKNTFCLSTGAFLYQSSYMGDLDFIDNFENYKLEINKLQELLNIKPQIVCCDLHPEYKSSVYAKSLGLPVFEVQHHYAHIASVMAEHELVEPIIGIAFDGTGYGEDKTVWGGEFFVATTKEYRRVGHLASFILQGGDKSVYDAKKTAACLLGSLGLYDNITDERWPIIKAAIDNQINVFKTSSMGRLFDAVSAILGICDHATYEGECAILIEACASEYNGDCASYRFNLTNEAPFVIDLAPCMKEIFWDLKNGCDKSYIAYRFHITIAESAIAICKRLRALENINKVALSGGVFQNKILLEQMLKKLADENFLVYINEKTPTNDGGISLGQAYLARFREGLECV